MRPRPPLSRNPSILLTARIRILLFMYDGTVLKVTGCDFGKGPLMSVLENLEKDIQCRYSVFVHTYHKITAL